ncbi:MAG: Sgt1-like protein [Amphiamblys sp. WSBS2006]|nr:MAG: Sgt1-like protein [Amphiamblys sp. WSBS2006]
MRITKHSWYQTPKTCTIDVFVECDDLRKEAAVEDLELALDGDMMRVSFKQKIEGVFECELRGEVESVSFELHRKKLELFLKKKEEKMWDSLEKKTEETEWKNEYPSSAKKKCNWEVDDKEVSGPPAGESATQFFFQQLYKSGSEEQRRAIMKSMEESGGTVLNNKWEDVKDKKVDRYKDKTKE